MISLDPIPFTINEVKNDKLSSITESNLNHSQVTLMVSKLAH